MSVCHSVLSLGRLCLGKGYSFEWKAGEKPTLTNSTGTTITLNVERLVPVLAAPTADESSIVEQPSSSSSDSPAPSGNDVGELFR